MNDEQVDGTAGAVEKVETPKPRKPRSDKGKKREQAYMATVQTDKSNDYALTILGAGKSAQAAIDEASKLAPAGAEVSVWQRVGKPRVAQMRLL